MPQKNLHLDIYINSYSYKTFKQKDILSFTN